jgi:hypothetical protein
MHPIMGTLLKGPKWLEVNSLFKFLQASLNQDVSKTNSEAYLALAQLHYASHLNNSSRYKGYNL